MDKTVLGINPEDLLIFSGYYEATLTPVKYGDPEFCIVTNTKDQIKKVACDFLQFDINFRTEDDAIYVGAEELNIFIGYGVIY